MKKLFYWVAGTALLAHANATSALTITGRWEDQIAGTVQSVDQAIITLLNVVSTFLFLLAVLYAVYGGFVILTAAGDEEKVKKWRTVIFHAILGLIVIFLAYSIVRWIVDILTGA